MSADTDDLLSRARLGDRRAQYLLAATLSRKGDRSEADRWLNAAAEAGEPDALYTLATRLLHRTDLLPEARDVLRRAKGSAAAIRQLAVLDAMGLGDVAGQDPLEPLEALAAAGDPIAARQVGAALLLGDPRHELGWRQIRMAAETDPVAAATLARGFAGGLAPVVRREAESAVALLARLGYPHADGLRLLVENGEPSRDSQPAPAMVSTRPHAYAVSNVVSAALCEYLIATASLHLRPATTIDPRDGSIRLDAYRKSLMASLSLVDLDIALVALNNKLAEVASQPAANGEFLSVLHYRTGDEYRPHYDCLPEGPDVTENGQRIVTALLYLNEAFEGGETHFLSPDVSYRGRSGDVLVFRNAFDDGRPDPSSRHAGRPVTVGTKWLASKWFRTKPFRF